MCSFLMHQKVKSGRWPYRGTRKSLGFKVLFHKRDFEPGVTLIHNIIMAVNKSKRTICVLSPIFVASPWYSWVFFSVQ